MAPGETVALLGPNGAGKSTTIDMLLGLAEPDTGTVSLFGARRPTRSRRAVSARCSRPVAYCATSPCASWCR
jgi:ABC-type multidrug transport system ATPase subunit